MAGAIRRIASYEVRPLRPCARMHRRTSSALGRACADMARRRRQPTLYHTPCARPASTRWHWPLPMYPPEKSPFGAGHSTHPTYPSVFIVMGARRGQGELNGSLSNRVLLSAQCSGSYVAFGRRSAPQWAAEVQYAAKVGAEGSRNTRLRPGKRGQVAVEQVDGRSFPRGSKWAGRPCEPRLWGRCT